jgi:hypothetical protein
MVINDSGDIIDGHTVEAPKLDPVQAEIERLSNEYSIESILTANAGVIPTTLQECAEIDRIIKAGIAAENEATLQPTDGEKHE